jgi:hypothetical protein
MIGSSCQFEKKPSFLLVFVSSLISTQALNFILIIPLIIISAKQLVKHLQKEKGNCFLGSRAKQCMISLGSIPGPPPPPISLHQILSF